jgi:hypothetical protein
VKYLKVDKTQVIAMEFLVWVSDGGGGHINFHMADHMAVAAHFDDMTDDAKKFVREVFRGEIPSA